MNYVNRQRGAGTRVLFDYKLKEAGISPEEIHGYDREAATHMAVAAAVSGGDADACMGIQSAARAMGLDFIEIDGKSMTLRFQSDFWIFHRYSIFWRFEKPGVCRESGEARWLWAGKNRRNFIFIKRGIRWEQLCVNYMCSGRGGQPGEAVESAWFRRGIGMEGDRHAAEVKGRTSLLAGEARTGWRSRQNRTLLPSLQGKPDNGGIDTTVKYGGSSGGGRGGVPRLRYGKKVFSECIYHEKEFSAAFRQEPYFGSDSGRNVSVSDEIMKLGKKGGTVMRRLEKDESLCIGCHQCEEACSKAFYKVSDQ